MTPEVSVPGDNLPVAVTRPLLVRDDPQRPTTAHEGTTVPSHARGRPLPSTEDGAICPVFVGSLVANTTRESWASGADRPSRRQVHTRITHRGVSGSAGVVPDAELLAEESSPLPFGNRTLAPAAVGHLEKRFGRERSVASVGRHRHEHPVGERRVGRQLVYSQAGSK
jgi:hypothetical protein